jgi:hypothetical protein
VKPKAKKLGKDDINKCVDNVPFLCHRGDNYFRGELFVVGRLSKDASAKSLSFGMPMD